MSKYASLCIERYGFDMQTMEIIPMEEFAGQVHGR